MRYFWVGPLLAAVASLALAIIVNRRGPRTPISRVFTFLACMLVLWNLNFFVLFWASDRAIAVALTRVFRVASLFMPPAILHLMLTFKTERTAVWRKIMIADYGLGSVLSAANAVDVLVSGLRQFPWGYSSVGGPFYNVFALFVVSNCCAALGVLLYDYRTTTDPRSRLQLKFWLAGALIALPLGLTNLLPSYGITFYPLGNLGEAAWATIVAYAIVRHRLMDIDVVITKGMAYAAVAFLLIAPAAALLLWLQRLSFGQIHAEFSVVVLSMLAAMGVLFPVLRMRAESRIGQSFFREKHEHRAALIAFTRSIVRILDRDRLLTELATTLVDTSDVDRIAIGLSDEGRRLFTIQHQIGIRPADLEMPIDHPFIACLSRRPQVVLRHELEDSSDASERTIVADACRRNGWEVCIPLTVGTKLTGFIGLGRKRNLEAFYAQDLELLETLAAEASIALENARLYEELKRSQDIIRRADRLSALGTLAAGIAHEVRNPLVSIQTFFQLAPDRLHDQEFFTSFLGMTANEVKRISNLITELLSFARSATPSLGPVNLNELADRVVTLLEPEARKNKLSLKRELSTPAAVVRADGDQIKQVLINLVLNAIQATAPGGTVSVATCVMNHRKGPLGQLQVRDTGSGIPQERIDHIFDPFFTTKDKGTGLGLAIAHQIVTEHGGSITVESREGQGTTFIVNLPAYGDETAAPAAPGDADDSDMQYALPRKIAL